MPGRLVLSVWFGILLLLDWECLGQSSDSKPTEHFRFREPRLTGYRVERLADNPGWKLASAPQEWLKAWPDSGSANYVHFGRRVVLQLRVGTDLAAVLGGRPLRLARTITGEVAILEAADAWTALRQAEDLAQDPRVSACYPVARRLKQLHGKYASKPNDPFFSLSEETADGWQAYLENRDGNGLVTGIDLNVRAAWPVTRGEGVLIAIVDTGFELDHPDLVDRTGGAPHFNFVTAEPSGVPPGSFSAHGTAVAGLAAATANNRIGIAGVAPLAQLASWVVFGRLDNIASDEALMDMFQYRSNIVAVQNHSWGNAGGYQIRLSLLEEMALSNAVQFGRSSRGVIMVRAGGNGRMDGGDVNDDPYAADPRVISVAAVRLDGRATGYSSPGACILVAAPSGDENPELLPCFPTSPNLITTDRQGALGLNRDTSSVGGGDYAFGENGFNGTSASAPQISGVVALMLATNPNLHYRDVQQILIHSSRLWDFSDPTVATNGAGFVVSHDLGFGVPDAGRAVQLAQSWPNRPPSETIVRSADTILSIPDLGLRLVVEGTDVPENLRSIPALPGAGPHPDGPTALLPLVDVGAATSVIAADLRGRAALIQRGTNFFCEKISFAAQAGAELAVIYNNRGSDVRMMMSGTDFTSIPSISISQDDGEALRDYLAADSAARAGLSLESVTQTFEVDQTLQCEFVGVRIDTDHSSRGDLRIVLTSPSGMRSVLQRVNLDPLPGPRDWTYYSVQHFYESSYGTWTLSISDEDTRGTGSLLGASLIITGIPITDTDRDGLDDAWELQHFGTLAQGPMDDPDQDEDTNVREQIMGTDPNRVESVFALDLSLWDSRLVRLSWPSNTNTTYRMEVGFESAAVLTVVTNLPGRTRETEWLIPYSDQEHRFFRLQSVPTEGSPVPFFGSSQLVVPGQEPFLQNSSRR